MREYQPFAISNFRTGFDESVEPWLLPKDAYQVLTNAHLYRGVIEKIEGYTIFAKFTNRNIKSLGTPDGVTVTWTGTLSPNLPVSSNIIAYGTIVPGSTAERFSYDSDEPDPSTIVNLIGSAGGEGTVNIATGDYSITFNTAPPVDAYSSMFIVWDSVPATPTAIMGIKQYFADNGAQDVLVFDQKRVGIIISNIGILSDSFGVNNVVSEIPHDYYQSTIFTGTGATPTFSGTLLGAPFVRGTLVWVEYDSTGTKFLAPPAAQHVVRDNGFGGLTGSNVVSGTINYITGAYTITFSGNIPAGNYYTSTTGIYGDLFTGSISDFFSLTNYQYKAFFTNNVDPIFYYDGISVHYLNTSLSVKMITSASGRPTFNGPTGFNISRCLHVFTTRQRLLLINATENAILAQSTIFWSTAGDPLDFTNDEELQESTSEPIRAIGYINTDLVVRFSNSESVFRYTGDAFSPFRFDSTNNKWACDAPYSAINYDSWFSTVGRPAIVGSNAVNVQRVDEVIPDFTDPSRLADDTPAPFLNQTSIKLCYGERFDDLKEGWLCYNSLPSAENGITPSDHVLAFNYLDETYAVYQFPFSCLGFGRIVNVPTWSTIKTKWEDMADTWDSFELTSNSLIDLAGDHEDNVFQLNTGNTLGDGETPVLMNIISRDFNPFIDQGQLARLGHVDLLVSADQLTKMRVQFYVNDQLYIDSNDKPAGYYQETTLTFLPKDGMSPNTNQKKVWKRIYVGSIGKTHTIRFYQNLDDFTVETLAQPINIHAMVLYMKPAGRVFS